MDMKLTVIFLRRLFESIGSFALTFKQQHHRISHLFILLIACTVGEALLNDGMALVLFEALITPEYDTSVKILYYFVRVIFISPLLGLAMGLGTITDLSNSDQYACSQPTCVFI